MADITVKNIPNDLYENLKNFATLNRRSLNKEIILCIEKAIRSRRIDKDQVIKRIRKIRSEINAPFLTDDKLNQIKNEGRL